MERHKHAFAFLLLTSALFFSGRRLNSIRTEESPRVCNRDHVICSTKRYQRRFTVAWTSFNPSVNSPLPTASIQWVTTPRCELSSHVVNRDLAGFVLSSRTKINKKKQLPSKQCSQTAQYSKYKDVWYTASTRQIIFIIYFAPVYKQIYVDNQLVWFIDSRTTIIDQTCFKYSLYCVSSCLLSSDNVQKV